MTEDRPTDAERAAVDRVLGAPDSVHAGAQARTPADDHVAYGGLAHAAGRRHLLLPALHALQDDVGWVSHGAINYIAQRMPIAPAEAYGVATFYDLIATEPAPPVVARVCDDIACKARGVDETLGEITERFGEEGTEVDGATWLRSPCLGRCEQGSAAFVQVAGETPFSVAPVTADQVIEILTTTTRPGPPEIPHIHHATDEAGCVTSLDQYLGAGGFSALRRSLAGLPDAVLDAVDRSKIRGRGGAAFPAGIKWRAVAAEPGPRYVVCNADESEPGTFKDRVLMETNPYRLIEAITIAGYAVGAAKGFIYLRGEYPEALAHLRTAIDEITSSGYLGVGIAGSEFDFTVELRRGAGAYICGEETALFNSIEGYRGEPRQKPPFPTQSGLFSRPTLINNVETLMAIPTIVAGGGSGYATVGTEESTGTKLFCVSGNVGHPGVYELPFGATTAELIDLAGGVDGELAAVLIGGAAGSFLPPDRLDMPLTFEDASAAGMSLGSGVVLVLNTDTDLAGIVARIASFFAHESCGLCVPCRVGTVRQSETVLRLNAGGSAGDVAMLSDLDAVLRDASICGLGQASSVAVQSALSLGLIGGAS